MVSGTGNGGGNLANGTSLALLVHFRARRVKLSGNKAPALAWRQVGFSQRWRWQKEVILLICGVGRNGLACLAACGRAAAMAWWGQCPAGFEIYPRATDSSSSPANAFGDHRFRS